MFAFKLACKDLSNAPTFGENTRTVVEKNVSKEFTVVHHEVTVVHLEFTVVFYERIETGQ